MNCGDKETVYAFITRRVRYIECKYGFLEGDVTRVTRGRINGGKLTFLDLFCLIINIFLQIVV